MASAKRNTGKSAGNHAGPAAETQSNAEAARFPAKKIRAVLDYCVRNRHCGFYRERYGKNRIDAGAIRSREDFEKLPLLSKKDVLKYQKTRDFRFVGIKDVAACTHTSGTTNEVLVTFNSKKDLRVKAGKECKHLACLKGSRALSVRPIGHLVGGTIKKFSQALVVADVYNLRLSAYLAKKMGVDTIVTSPTLALKIGSLLAENGYPLRKIRLLCLGGEGLSKMTKKALKARFPSAKIIMKYATSEFSTIGYQCPQTFGTNVYHTYPRHHLYEVIDPESGKVRRAGEEGELVVTTLWTETASPMVRYRTGDSAKFLENTCACGATGQMISLPGRAGADRVRISGITLLQESIDKAVEAAGHYLTGEYRAHVLEKGRKGNVLPYLVVRAIPRENTPDTREAREDAAAIIMNRLKLTPEYNWERGVERGILAPVEVRFVEETGMPAHKTARIIDQRTSGGRG